MDTKENQNPFFSIHLPLTLIAFAFALFFYLNVGGAKQTAENLEWQNKNNVEQIKALKEQRVSNEKALEQNKAYVATAEQTQKQFGEIMKDLLEIADSGDEDAKLIVKTYGIAASNSTPAAAPAATPAATPENKDEKKNP